MHLKLSNLNVCHHSCPYKIKFSIFIHSNRHCICFFLFKFTFYYKLAWIFLNFLNMWSHLPRQENPPVILTGSMQFSSALTVYCYQVPVTKQFKSDNYSQLFLIIFNLNFSHFYSFETFLNFWHSFASFMRPYY